jgi:tetratricopeptide (TPR) repeat protein
MLRFLGTAVEGRFRLPSLFIGLLILAGIGVGFCFYAAHQLQVARIAIQQDRLDDAEKSLRIYLFVWPRDVPGLVLAARTARMKGDFDTAEAYLKRCLKLQKEIPEAVQIEFLLMRVQHGEEDTVVGELLQCVDNKSPESALILESLSRAYMRNLRFREAFVTTSRWIELEPENETPFRWRGWVHDRLGDWERAISDYRRALELNPDSPMLRLRLAEILLERTNPPEALALLEPLYLEFPDRPEIQARLGQCRFVEGELEKARPLLESAVREMPDDATLLITLARLEMQESHYLQAERWLRHTLKVDETDPEAQFLLASCLQFQGRTKEADALLEQHRKDSSTLKRVMQMIHEEVDRPSRDPAPPYEIGAAFIRSNERIGVYWLHKALARDANYQPALKTLAEHFEKKGEKPRAAQYRRRLKAEPNSDQHEHGTENRPDRAATKQDGAGAKQ